MRSLSLALLPLLLAGAVEAQQSTLGPADGRNLPAIDLERVKDGQIAPDFTLEKYGGGTLTLSQFRAQKNVVLVFYRGYWCPFCIQQLKDLRALLEPDLKGGTELLVVSIDGPQETRMAVSRVAEDGREPDFTFLSDPASEVIGRYGILNPSGSRRGIPHPAVYVIDRSGVIRWSFVETDYKVRPDNASIQQALRAIPGL
jgi:peroxiredoxin